MVHSGGRNDRTPNPYMGRTLGLGALVLAVGTFLYMPVVICLLFGGVVFGVFLNVASQNLAQWGRVPRRAALMLIVAGTLMLIGALLLVTVPGVIDQLQELLRNLPSYLRQDIKKLRGIDTDSAVFNELADQLARAANQLPEDLIGRGMQLFSRAAGILSNTLGALAVLLTVFVVAVYLALEPEMYVRGVLFLLPDHWHASARRIMTDTSRALAWWFLGQLFSVFLLFIVTSLGLWLIGVPFALMFGVFTGLMTFIPNVGPVIAAVPTLLVALTQGVPETGATLVLLIVLQNLEGLFITPSIHRRIIHMPPALVLASMLILGQLVGVIGMFIAMPLVVVILTMAQGIKTEWQVVEGLASEPNEVKEW